MKFNIDTESEYSKKLNEEKLIKRADMHSFHRYYGKLIPAIPGLFIKEFTEIGDTVFDPFSGSGTVAVESKRLGRNFIGAEVNPLSVNVARAKTYSLNQETLEKINDEIINALENNEFEVSENEIPYILNREHWFKDFVQKDLVKIRKCIDNYFDNLKGYDDKTKAEYKSFYLITLSAIIKNVSNADTRHVFPGRSKRMVALEQEGKIHIDVMASFKRAVKARAKYYDIYTASKAEAEFLEGDVTQLDLSDYENKIDLIVTNPPYISSVRYIETLKLELYWTETIKSLEEYNSLSHQIIGNDRLKKSEYTDIELTNYDDINNLINRFYEIDPKSAKIIGEFFNKMEIVLGKAYKLLKPNKRLVMKISDSKLKKIKIPTGEFLNLIAENLGFTLKDVFLDEINNNSRSLTLARNTYSDIITHDYIIIWEKN